MSYEEMKRTQKMDDYDSDMAERKFIKRLATGVGIFLVLSVGGCMAVTPQYSLYKSNTEKKQVIGEAKARADAAFYEAQRNKEVAEANAAADVIRAQGVAESQRLIAETLSPEYIQWLYVDQMDRMAENGKATIIYVPTEGGIPIMEAGRSTDTTVPQQ